MPRMNIEAERARLGLTKAQFESALGITDKTYRAYINGAAIPSTILEKLRDMTGKSLEYLLNLEG